MVARNKKEDSHPSEWNGMPLDKVLEEALAIYEQLVIKAEETGDEVSIARIRKFLMFTAQYCPDKTAIRVMKYALLEGLKDAKFKTDFNPKWRDDI